MNDLIVFLVKALVIVLVLVILIPLIMLLFGEGALAYKIFGWALGEPQKQEMFVPEKSESDGEGLFSGWFDSNDEASAVVKGVTIKHNVRKKGKDGMTMAVEFDSKNLKGESLICMVLFYNSDGSPLPQTHNDHYRSQNGNVFVGEYTSPPYNSCNTTTTLFIPYEELLMNGNGQKDFLLEASILHYTSDTDFDVLCKSNVYSVRLKGK